MKTIEKSNRKYWIIAATVILVFIGAFAAYQWLYLPNQVVESEETSVQTSTARIGDIILYAAGAGTLIPSAEVDVSFEISAGVQEELVDLMVGVGDNVEAGDILARLDDSDRQEILTEAQRTLRELTSASAIAGMEKELADTKIDLENILTDLIGLISLAVYRAEEYVEEYTLALIAAQAEMDDLISDETEQKLKSAEQDLNWANSNLQAQWEYYYEDYVPENFEYFYWENREKIYYTDAPSDAEIASVRAEINLAEANIAELEVLLLALRNNEELPEEATGSQASAIRDARKNVDDALEDLGATTLVAPISGTVTEIFADVTDRVGNDVLLVISDLTPPTLEAYFDESDWKNIQEGFPVEVIFDALPDLVYEGQVVHVDPGLVNQNNSTVVYSLVEVDISSTGWSELPVGSSAGVDVIGGKAENAVLVPVEALREISGGEFAVFVIEDGQPRMRLVDVGLQDLIFAEILLGIQPGEVVTTGQVETAQ